MCTDMLTLVYVACPGYVCESSHLQLLSLAFVTQLSFLFISSSLVLFPSLPLFSLSLSLSLPAFSKYSVYNQKRVPILSTAETFDLQLIDRYTDFKSRADLTGGSIFHPGAGATAGTSHRRYFPN